MIPPNEEYCDRICVAMLPRVAASTYPEPAAVEDAGAPINILTSLLGDVVLAQLSLQKICVRRLKDY